MDQFLNLISDIRVVVVIGVIVLLLALWLLINKVRTKKLRRELEDLEKHYNKVKSVPLSFKMNKAVSIGRVDQATTAKVNTAKQSFDEAQGQLRKISDNIADAEDSILAGKLRHAREVINEITPAIVVSERKVSSLDGLLDDILSKETEQRQEVTGLKNRFRALKSQAEENASRLSFNWSAVEKKITDTERMFSTFEEWMYSSDFEKANAELDTIRMSMQDLDHMVETMPGLIEEARGVIPSMVETLHTDFVHNRNRGVYLKHLEIDKNMAVISASLKEDLKKLKQGEDEGVREHLDSYKTRIQQMDDSIKAEASAYGDMKKARTQVSSIAVDVKKNLEFVNRQFKANCEKFGLDNLKGSLEDIQKKFNKLEDKRPQILDTISNTDRPATEVMAELKQLYHDYSDCNNTLRSIKESLEVATGDEDRARKQIVKLQIIMNQLQVKIRKYKLPNISDTYQEDMKKAQEYISHLTSLIDHSPIDMQLLNSTLQEALDFIYKLYNNVNNTVGTVVMVENTIVFGNRYRSTYPDIDSELTRSELAFRNGEYTQALKIAIATIEKIHPGNYEHMIRENAKSA